MKIGPLGGILGVADNEILRELLSSANQGQAPPEPVEDKQSLDERKEQRRDGKREKQCHCRRRRPVWRLGTLHCNRSPAEQREEGDTEPKVPPSRRGAPRNHPDGVQKGKQAEARGCAEAQKMVRNEVGVPRQRECHAGRETKPRADQTRDENNHRSRSEKYRKTWHLIFRRIESSEQDTPIVESPFRSLPSRL